MSLNVSVAICSSGKSHHFNFNKSLIISFVNLYLRILAGHPAIIEYGSVSWVTTEFEPIIQPSAIFIPSWIMTLLPIQTSLPTVTGSNLKL